jgi:hypothetical protein
MKKIVKIGLIVLIFVITYALVSVYGGPDLTVVNVTMKQTDNGNFVLFVSNQSFKTRLVDMTIYIDDKLALKGNFDVVSQHNFREFQFSLSNGTHKIYVESINGDAKLEKEFEITSKQYAYLFYDTPSNSTDSTDFTFLIQDQPIGLQ